MDNRKQVATTCCKCGRMAASFYTTNIHIWNRRLVSEKLNHIINNI